MDKNWKSLLQNDKNFAQKVPYDIKSVDEKLTLASQDLEHLILITLYLLFII